MRETPGAGESRPEEEPGLGLPGLPAQNRIPDPSPEAWGQPTPQPRGHAPAGSRLWVDRRIPPLAGCWLLSEPDLREMSHDLVPISLGPR